MIGPFASAPCFMPWLSGFSHLPSSCELTLSKNCGSSRGFWKLSLCWTPMTVFSLNVFPLTLWKGNRIYTLFLLTFFSSASNTTVFSFFSFWRLCFDWSLIASWRCVSFCCVAWISDMYTQSPSLWRLPPAPRGPYRAPCRAPCALRQCPTSCSFTRGHVHTSDLPHLPVCPALPPTMVSTSPFSRAASLFLPLQTGSSVPSFWIPYMCVTIWCFLIIDLSFPISFGGSSFFSQP